MNTTIEKIFEEIGRLHVQIQQQAVYIAQLEAKNQSLQQAVVLPAAPAVQA
jgi:hypothetical protein